MSRKKWEHVCDNGSDEYGPATEYLQRIEVPGGWLYLHENYSSETESMCFVPDMSRAVSKKRKTS